MTATDIQVGDLIKATNREDRDVTITGRVKDVNDYWVFTTKHTLTRDITWDFEVLERPIPPVEDELLLKAIKAYRGPNTLGYDDQTLRDSWGPGITAVINTVREFDSKKENSK